MRRQDRESLNRSADILIGSLALDLPERKKQKMRKSFYPIIRTMQEKADRLIYERLQNVSVRSYYRPRLPQ